MCELSCAIHTISHLKALLNRFYLSELGMNKSSHSGVLLSASHPKMQERGIGIQDPHFVLGLEDKYKCPICSQRLQCPVQTSCGHSFCFKCFGVMWNVSSLHGELVMWPGLKEECYRTGKVCHYCVQARNRREAFLDRRLEREILSLEVYCPYGYYSNPKPLEHQLSKEEDEEDQKHKEPCQWRGLLSSVEEHLKQCLSVELRCPMGCGQIMPRGKLNSHTAYYCSSRPVTCSLCHLTISAGQLPQHNKVCCKEVPTRKCTTETSEEKANQILNHIKQQLVDSMRKEFNNIRIKTEKVEGMTQLLEGQLAEVQRKLNSSVESEPQPTIAEQAFCVEPSIARRGLPFVWKSTRRPRNSFFNCVSPSILTEPQGYWVRLERTYNDSIVLYLQEGCFDGQLPWPFLGTWRISILNQVTLSGI